jgi:ABC-2 type transport system permease protein
MTGVTADPTVTGPVEQQAPPERQAARERSIPRAGWMVIAGKEFGDHLLSSRFIVLAIIMSLAAAVPLYFLGNAIRQAAEGTGAQPALFAALFVASPPVNDQITLPSVTGFLALVGPLLGLAFAFDSINGERANGTLPRLLSQPIHRDDVVNGKFAAGLAVISLVLVVMVLGVTAFALIRLGIVPKPPEIIRVVLWLLVTITYIGLWLAFGMLLSVAIRRAATSALVGFGVWLLFTIFGGLFVSLMSGLLAPAGATAEEELRNIGVREALIRLQPNNLYQEAAFTLLNPQVTSISTPDTIGSYVQRQQQVATLFSFDQSLMLVWPQVVTLFGLTAACFALAYVLFMRQEVRA